MISTRLDDEDDDDVNAVIFSNWSGHSMFSTLLAVMHFHFVLDLTLLLHVGLNRLAVSFSHHRGGLPICRFRSFRLHSIIAQVHLLSVNTVTCPAQRNFHFRYITTTPFSPRSHFSLHNSPCRSQYIFFLGGRIPPHSQNDKKREHKSNKYYNFQISFNKILSIFFASCVNLSYKIFSGT